MAEVVSKGGLGPVLEWVEDKMVGKKQEKANAAQAEAAAQKQKEAEATVLAQKAEDEKKAKRASLMSATTSGFGANTNLARSFLTSL
ncbi:MAG: hypothetical protein GX638_18810 [Crenarchaeota archaeon]|nr:hypothetical protein [Thermoproteota archaeon]